MAKAKRAEDTDLQGEMLSVVIAAVEAVSETAILNGIPRHLVLDAVAQWVGATIALREHRANKLAPSPVLAQFLEVVNHTHGVNLPAEGNA